MSLALEQQMKSNPENLMAGARGKGLIEEEKKGLEDRTESARERAKEAELKNIHDGYLVG